MSNANLFGSAAVLSSAFPIYLPPQLVGFVEMIIKTISHAHWGIIIVFIIISILVECARDRFFNHLDETCQLGRSCQSRSLFDKWSGRVGAAEMFGVLIALATSAAPLQRRPQFATVHAFNSYRPLKDAEGNPFVCLFDAYNSSSFAYVPGVASLPGCFAACDGSNGCTGIEFAAWRQTQCAHWLHGACSSSKSPGFKEACPVDGVKAETYVRCNGMSCSEPAVTLQGTRRQLTECNVRVMPSLEGWRAHRFCPIGGGQRGGLKYTHMRTQDRGPEKGPAAGMGQFAIWPSTQQPFEVNNYGEFPHLLHAC